MNPDEPVTFPPQGAERRDRESERGREGEKKTGLLMDVAVSAVDSNSCLKSYPLSLSPSSPSSPSPSPSPTLYLSLSLYLSLYLVFLSHTTYFIPFPSLHSLSLSVVISPCFS